MRTSAILRACCGATMLRAPFRVLGVSHCKESLEITWQDGAVSQFPSAWLRNSVRDDIIFDTQTFIYNQRSFADFSAKESPIISASYKQESDDVSVEWPDHSTVFNASWLRARDSTNANHLTNGKDLELWDASNKLDITYDFAERKGKLSSWMNDLRKYGIAFFKDVPANDTGLRDLLESIGQVMQRTHPTNHLTISVDPQKIAESDLHIYSPDKHPVHMDTSYYSAPARLTGLLATEYNAPVEDTVNYYVDSLKVIEDIRKEEPEAYELLKSVPARFARRRMTVQEPVEPERVPAFHFETLVKTPFIGYDEGEDRPMLRFSNKQCGIDPDATKDPQTMRRFFEAVKLLETKLTDPENHQQLVLRQGWCAVFNNWRVCHGRSAVHPTTRRTLMLSFISDITWKTRWRILLGETAGLDPKWLYGCSEKELEILANRFEK
ncbi:trimethyllysine dioxygenase [Nematostella vectensis]|uniref:trimethyllysine dioxygenase n=1 Tax=Nematostella vectensis TaxID=45351 RepID=UPI002077010C|nr:trimethyllysine dioxygenase [Nematostella vectensis]XP_048588562.1 trimethyllysine dioxygenase [Nematostella vectensis]